MNLHTALSRILVPLALMALALALLFALPQRAAAQAMGGSILIWPVGPVIEANERAAALWLENPGQAPITLQLRIYAWAQQDGKNVYAAQDAILGTPPIVTIAPGEKQLVRLTRTVAATPGTEGAYRVIVDEIPAAKPSSGTGAAVTFRMRYSLPLFVHGPGLLLPGRSTDKAAPRKDGGAGRQGTGNMAGPLLDWRIAEAGEGAFLEIRNRGAVHARLTDAAFGGTSMADGLLGYVLPGSMMRWPIPPGASRSGHPSASVNAAPSAPIEPRTD